MRNSLRAIGVLAVASLVNLQFSIAQTTTTQPETIGGASDESDVALAVIKSDFDLLKILGITAIVVSVAVGLALYAYRHKRLMQYDAIFGLLLTVVGAPILFFTFTYILGPESRACFSAAVAAGADAVPFDSACSAARESAANMIGLKSLWRMIMGETIVNGLIAPLAAGAVKFLMYLSVVLGAALTYLAIRPVLKKLG